MNKENRFRILATLVLLVLPCVCFSQARKSSPQRVTPDRTAPFLQQARALDSTSTVTRLELRNGLTILVEEFRSQPVVSIQFHIHAGTFQEPTNSIGVSRLLSAVIERGSASAGRSNIRQGAHALGGIFHRSVDYENAEFEIVVPSSQWKQALALQVGAISKPLSELGDLALDADRVIDEARTALQDPREFTKEMLLELAFNESRIGKNSEILRSDLHALKPQNLIDFYKAMYGAQRITIAVSGDVGSSEVFNEIVRLYGKSAVPAIKPGSSPLSESQSTFRYRWARGSIAVPQIILGFHAAPESDEDYRALEVLNAVLGLGEASILNARLRDQMKLILAAETSLLANKKFGYLLMRMDADAENIDRSEIAALTELELLKRINLDKAEVVRAQAQLELEYWRHRETATDRAETLAYYEALGNWKRPANYISEIRKVEPGDIRRVANKYLRMERCSLVEYLPESGAPRDTTVEGMRQVLEGLLRSSADLELEKREKEVIPFVKIPETPERFTFSEVQYPFQVASILRGPDMLIREDHTSPVIEMGFFFRGGKSAEKKENAGITHLMMQSILRGTKEIPMPQFQRQLEIYGARTRPVVQDDYFGVALSVLSGNFSAAFELLQQAFKAPVFDKDSSDRLREIQKQQILMRKNSKLYARDLLNQALFGDFSYSTDRLGSESGISTITDASILGWHGEYVKNRKPYVVIIGDTKGSSLSSHFVKHFSGSRIQETKIPEEWVKPLEKPQILERDWNWPESMILIGFQAAPMDDEDGSTMRVLAALIENRDRLSGIDGESLQAGNRVLVDFIPRLRGGSFIASAVADPKNEEMVFNALKGEILKTVSGPNTYRDIRSAISAAVGAHQIRNQSRSEQIQHVIMNLLAGRGIEGFLNLPADLQLINAEDLVDVGQKSLNLQKAVIVRMHGKSKQSTTN